MNNLYTELKNIIPNELLSDVVQHCPINIGRQIQISKFDSSFVYTDNKFLEFMKMPKNRVQITSFPGNWHMPWQKTTYPIIRLPIEYYTNSVEFVIDSKDEGKKSMISNDYNVYEIPYKINTAYILLPGILYTVVNFSEKPRHVIDIVSDKKYSEVADYFKDFIEW